jgi:hypothetical protein
MKIFALSLLTMTLGFTTLANAKPKANYDWLHYGFTAIIQPASGGGQSIALFYTGEGFLVCNTVSDPSNGVVPAPGHCNNRLMDVGYQIPPYYLFGDLSIFEKAKAKFKAIMPSIPIALASFSEFGVFAEAATATAGISAPDTAGKIKAEYELGAIMKDLQKQGANSHERLYATATMGFKNQDVIDAISDRVNKYVDYCNKHSLGDQLPPGTVINENSSPEEICTANRENFNKATTLMGKCNIAEIPANAGEKGQQELWIPGDTLPDDCEKTLNDTGYDDLAKWANEKVTRQKAFETETIDFLSNTIDEFSAAKRAHSSNPANTVQLAPASN